MVNMARSNKTSISSIVDYWSERVDECDLGVDWSEAEEYCWRCGTQKDLMRCHIVPHALGGKDAPSNYVLLCQQCHEENPNVADPEIMWDWLMACGADFYDSFWYWEGLREYEFIYRRKLEDDLALLVEHGGLSIDTLKEEMLSIAREGLGSHFGQARSNKATVAGFLRMFLKKKAKDMGIDLPDNRRPSLTRDRLARERDEGNGQSSS